MIKSVGHSIKNASKKAHIALGLTDAIEFTLVFIADRGTPECKALMDLAMAEAGMKVVYAE